MSMTLNNMAIEVAKVIGGVNDATIISLSQSAIKGSIEDWNSAKYWNSLLKDTSIATLASAGTITNAVASVAPLTTGGFDFVNVGQTVTVSSSGTPTTTLAASTTVSSVTRGSDGVITSITLSNAFAVAGGGSTTSTGVILSFSADIPIIAGTNEYNLPLDFLAPHGARTTTNKWQLTFIKYREWNRKVPDQTSQGAIEAYTVYNPVSPTTQSYGRTRMRVFRTPSTNDAVHLQYFRFMNPDATTVDVPDRFLRKFIAYAQWYLVRSKNAEDTRLTMLEQIAKQALSGAMVLDEELSDDEDVRMISQLEAWDGGRQLWGNGAFWPTMMDY